MADIHEYVEAIQEAVYGEEVRGSICDALTAMNTQIDESEVSAGASAAQAAISAATALTQATTATNMATNATSYAVGGTGTRTGEDADNAKYYKEQCERISQGLAGALLPMGTVTFAQLDLQTKQSGYMYNISDAFTSTSDFKDGGGIDYPAGSNVYYTADNMWDVLAGADKSNYSLTNGEVIPTNADLNDYDEFGNYFCPDNPTANTLSNCPVKNKSFMLHVEKVRDLSGDTACKQRMVCYDYYGIEYWREKVSGTWGIWYEINPARLSSTSNPNLLDNPWFTVNQRGITTLTNTGSAIYCIDRWQIRQSECVVVNNKVTINFINEVSEGYGYFSQHTLVSDLDILGKTITLSAKISANNISDGILYLTIRNSTSATANNNRFGRVEIPNGFTGIISVTVDVPSTLANDYFCIDFEYGQPTTPVSDQSITIDAVKLEIGSVSTLAMDTAPNYQQELAKCQRYFYRLVSQNGGVICAQGMNISNNTTNKKVRVNFITPIIMRDSPTVTFDDLTQVSLRIQGNSNIVNPTNSEVLPKNSSLSTIQTNCITVDLTVADAIATPYASAVLSIGWGHYVDFNAEI